MNNTHKQIEAVKEALNLSKKHKLENEVMCFAMKHLKESPNISIEEALRRALKDWDLEITTYSKTYNPYNKL